MTDNCLELIQICESVQRTIISPRGPLRSLIEYTDITVEFPSQQETLTRLQDFMACTQPSQYAVISGRYWQACRQLQNQFNQEYENFCHSAPSMEQYGGISDLEVQSQVARGFATRYRELEGELAEVVFRKFQREHRLNEAVEDKQTTNKNTAKVSLSVFIPMLHREPCLAANSVSTGNSKSDTRKSIRH